MKSGILVEDNVPLETIQEKAGVNHSTQTKTTVLGGACESKLLR